MGNIKKYQCSQLVYGAIVTLLDGGMDDSYYPSGGVLRMPKRPMV